MRDAIEAGYVVYTRTAPFLHPTLPYAQDHNLEQFLAMSEPLLPFGALLLTRESLDRTLTTALRTDITLVAIQPTLSRDRFPLQNMARRINSAFEAKKRAQKRLIAVASP